MAKRKSTKGQTTINKRNCKSKPTIGKYGFPGDGDGKMMF
jgi:hypothetical protein